MRLSELVGMPAEEEWPTEPRSERARCFGLLVRAAEGLHRARVVVSPADYYGFTPLEREALARAGDRTRAREVLSLADALLGRRGEASVPLDGGETLLVEELEDLLDQTEERLA